MPRVSLYYRRRLSQLLGWSASSDKNLNDPDLEKIRLLYGSHFSIIPSVLISRVIFLDDENIVRRICRDSLRILAFGQSLPSSLNEYSSVSMIDGLIVNFFRSKPKRVYSLLFFQHFLRSLEVSGNRDRRQIDLSFWSNYLLELRSIFKSLSLDERDNLRSGIGMLTANELMRYVNDDSRLLLIWSISEAAKFCITNKYMPNMPPNEFLDLISDKVSLPFALVDKQAKLSLSFFIYILDMMTFDRISSDSTTKLTFPGLEKDTSDFYTNNSEIFRSWFDRYRHLMAKFDLYLDNPAGCWRHANVKLHNDLSVRISQMYSSEGQVVYKHDKPLLTINNYLELFVLSAKYLGDIHTLRGLQRVISNGIILPEYPPLKSIISNLEGRAREVVQYFEDDDRAKSEQELIEYLDSCIELGILSEKREYVQMLKSEKSRNLYNLYIISMDPIESKDLDLKNVEDWMKSWSTLEAGIEEPINRHLNVIIPTCLNVITKACPNDKYRYTELARWLIGRSYIPQAIFTPVQIDERFQIYPALLDIVKDDSLSVALDTIEARSKDLRWNYLMYRHLMDLNLINIPGRIDHIAIVESIRLNAARYQRGRNEISSATRIAEDLLNSTTRIETKFLASLFQSKCNNKAIQLETYYKFSEGIEQLPTDVKLSLKFKLVRHLIRDHLRGSLDTNIDWDLLRRSLKFSSTEDFEVEELDKFLRPKLWQAALDSSSLKDRTKTLHKFALLLNHQLESMKCQSDSLINELFLTRLLFLESLACYDPAEYQAEAEAQGLEFGIGVLESVIYQHPKLSKVNFDKFSSDSFIDSTLEIWRPIKANLMTAVLEQDDLDSSWRDVLVDILKRLAMRYPNQMIYEITVNRIEYQNHINDYEKRVLAVKSEDENKQEDNDLSKYQRGLVVINELGKSLQKSQSFHGNWSKVAAETEEFVKELCKIAVLTSEKCKRLVSILPSELYRFFGKFVGFRLAKDPFDRKRRLEACEQQLDNLVSWQKESFKKLHDFDPIHGPTIHDLYFANAFDSQLEELGYRIGLLAKKRPLENVLATQMLQLIRSIISLVDVCKAALSDYHRGISSLLMGVISHRLAKLEPSSIPMPNCHEQENIGLELVNIFKVKQNVTMIHSLTSPKKLEFVGTDGKTHAFILKAHDDLRIDAYVMNIFYRFNRFLSADKSTRGQCFINRYSVTPLSSNSGLIELVQGSSFGELYRTWVTGKHGQERFRRLFADTCPKLCNSLGSSEVVHHCELPSNPHGSDLYYQLLWAMTRPSKLAITEKRPNFRNGLKYRSSFELSVYESLIETLIAESPKELLSSQLWTMSSDPHSLWLKTKNFINSCATISMVGYIIGLGDRHLSNILIHPIGSVTHIDLNLSFELGCRSSYPEVVPFRLTHNMIYAFGFAGLEGRFTDMSCNVLSVLRRKAKTIIPFLNPTHYCFIASDPVRDRDSYPRSIRDDFNLGDVTKLFDMEFLKLVDTPETNQESMRPNAPSDRIGSDDAESLELDLHSQESLDLGVVYRLSPERSIANLLDLDANAGVLREGGHGLSVEPIKPEVVGLNKCDRPIAVLSHELGQNDRNHKLLTLVDLQNIYKRMRDKLIGADESLKIYNRDFVCRDADDLSMASPRQTDAVVSVNASKDRPGDLIFLDDIMSVEDQVKSLIAQATSLKNKAKMFQGWTAWI